MRRFGLLAGVVALAAGPLAAQHAGQVEVGAFGSYTRYDATFGLAHKIGGGVRIGYLLGNISERPLLELIVLPQQQEFGQAKRSTLPRYCLDCDVRFACNGGCPKDRFAMTPDGEPGLHYLCAGYKDFFHHVSEPMRAISPISSSVIPSEKYSCAGLPDRFSSGSTAMDSIRRGDGRRRRSPTARLDTATRPPPMASIPRRGMRGLGAAPGAMPAGVVSTSAMNRYPR